ncbi:MAG: radical SAM protein [Clostridia bacterium]|nr:radical SAM protein [Clostridia bacterium]
MNTITYIVGDSLYVNITNRCTNRCEFCIRNLGDGAYGSNSLWLDSEPTEKEIIESILSHDLSKYKELVYCGYGEPMMRVKELVASAKAVKEVCDIKIRINTNGHGNFIHKSDITPMLDGCIDVVSISLNSSTEEGYAEVCHPVFSGALEQIKKFAGLVKEHVPTVIFSVVETTVPDEDIEGCKAIANELGIPLRIRELVK